MLIQPDRFVDHVVDRGFGLIDGLVAVRGDPLDVALQHVGDRAGDGIHQHGNLAQVAVVLVGFSDGVSVANDALVELAQGFVLRIAAGAQVFAVGQFTGQKQGGD